MTDDLGEWIESQLPGLVSQPAGVLRHPYLTIGSHYSANGITFLWDAFFEAARLWHEGERFAEAIRGTVECFLDTIDPVTGVGRRIISPSGPLISSEEQMQPFICQFAYVSNLLLQFDNPSDVLLKLKATLDFWLRDRNTPLGLCRWLDSFESGVDMNPAVDRCSPLCVIGVDLNVHLVMEYRALGRLAMSLGDSALASDCDQKQKRLAEGIRKYLWNETAGVFCNVDARSGKFILDAVEGFGEQLAVLPWTNFTPLYAGIADQAQASEMIERYLLNPDAFRCQYGFRTFDRHSAFYSDQRVCVAAYLPHRLSQPTGSNWIGPVWVLCNYMLAHGLANYGHKQQALEIAQETAELCLKSINTSGCLFESYDASTGQGLWADGYLSWNILADKMAEETETGKFALRDIVGAGCMR